MIQNDIRTHKKLCEAESASLASAQEDTPHVTPHHPSSSTAQWGEEGESIPSPMDPTGPSAHPPASARSPSAEHTPSRYQSLDGGSSPDVQEGSSSQLDRRNGSPSTQQPVSLHSSSPRQSDSTPLPLFSQTVSRHLKLHSSLSSYDSRSPGLEIPSSPLSFFFSSSRSGIAQQEKDFIAQLSAGSPASLLSPLLSRVSVDTSDFQKTQSPQFLSSIRHATLHTASDPDAGWAVKLDFHMFPDSPPLPSSSFSLHTTTTTAGSSSSSPSSPLSPQENPSGSALVDNSLKTKQKSASRPTRHTARHLESSSTRSQEVCSSPPVATARAVLQGRHTSEEGRCSRHTADREGPEGGLCVDRKSPEVKAASGRHAEDSRTGLQDPDEEVYSVVFSDPTDELWGKDIAICVHWTDEKEEHKKKERLPSARVSPETAGSSSGFLVSPATLLAVSTSPSSSEIAATSASSSLGTRRGDAGAMHKSQQVRQRPSMPPSLSSSSASTGPSNDQETEEDRLSTLLPSPGSILMASGHVPDACVLGRVERSSSWRGKGDGPPSSAASPATPSVCLKPRVLIHMTDSEENSAGSESVPSAEEARLHATAGNGEATEKAAVPRQKEGVGPEKRAGIRERGEQEGRGGRSFWRIAGGEDNAGTNSGNLLLPSIRASPTEASLDDTYDVQLLLPLRFGLPAAQPETGGERHRHGGHIGIQSAKDESKSATGTKETRSSRLGSTSGPPLQGGRAVLADVFQAESQQWKDNPARPENPHTGSVVEKKGQGKSGRSEGRLLRSLRSSLLVAKSVVSGGCEGAFQNQALSWLPLRPFVGRRNSPTLSKEVTRTHSRPRFSGAGQEEAHTVDAERSPGLVFAERNTAVSSEEGNRQDEEKGLSMLSDGRPRSSSGDERTGGLRQANEEKEEFIDAVLPLSLSVHGENLPLDIALCMYSSKLDVHPMTLAHVQLGAPPPVLPRDPLDSLVASTDNVRNANTAEHAGKKAEEHSSGGTDVSSKQAPTAGPEALWRRVISLPWRGLWGGSEGLSAQGAGEWNVFTRLQSVLWNPGTLSARSQEQQQRKHPHIPAKDAGLVSTEEERRVGGDHDAGKIVPDSVKGKIARERMHRQRGSSERFVGRDEQGHQEDTLSSGSGLEARTGKTEEAEGQWEEKTNNRAQKSADGAPAQHEPGTGTASLGDTWLVYVPFAVMLGAAAGYVATLHWQAYVKMKEARAKSLCLGPCCTGEWGERQQSVPSGLAQPFVRMEAEAGFLSDVFHSVLPWNFEAFLPAPKSYCTCPSL